MNYCRNPDGGKTIWCFTTDPKKRWEYCLPLNVNKTGLIVAKDLGDKACNSNYKCDIGEGNCKRRDINCKQGLKCFQRDGYNYWMFPPGVYVPLEELLKSGMTWDADFCYDPNVTTAS